MPRKDDDLIMEDICPHCGQFTGGDSICPSCGSEIFDDSGLVEQDEDEGNENDV